MVVSIGWCRRATQSTGLGCGDFFLQLSIRDRIVCWGTMDSNPVLGPYGLRSLVRIFPTKRHYVRVAVDC